jgi:hypothetical protein
MSILDRLTQLFRSRSQRDQEQRMAIQERDRAQTPEEEISHREARRLVGMSAEDRAWEQASLESHRKAQDHSTRSEP